MITHLDPLRDLPNRVATGDASVAAGSTPTWSAWTQLIASVPFPISHWMLTLFAADSSGGMSPIDVEIQLGIGAAGSEVNLLGSHDFAIYGVNNHNAGFTKDVFFPKFLGSGFRISFRARSGLSTTTVRAVLSAMGR